MMSSHGSPTIGDRGTNVINNPTGSGNPSVYDISGVTITARPYVPDNSTLDGFFWTAAWDGYHLGLINPPTQIHLGALINETVGTHNVETAQTKFDNATTQALVKAVQKLEAAITDLDSKLAAIPDNTIIRYTDQNGHLAQMTAGDFKALWNKFDFTVTDMTPGLYRGGSVAEDNSTGRVTDNFYFGTIYDQFHHNSDGSVSPVGWSLTHNGLDQTGMRFILMHEIGHMTDAGLAMNSNSFAAAGRPYDPNAFANTSYFAANEKFANDFARDSANNLHLHIDGVVDPPFHF